LLQKPIPNRKSLLDKGTLGQRTNKISYFFNLSTLKNKKGKTIAHSNPNSQHREVDPEPVEGID